MKEVNKKVVAKKVVAKKVVAKKVTTKKAVLNMGSRKGSKGIGIFIKNCIIDMMLDGNLDYNVIDKKCLEKFGADRTGNTSRIKSIKWHMVDLKNFDEWNGVELVWDEIDVE